MTIPKAQIIDFLNSNGKGDLAQQADGLLPDEVDLDQYTDQLASWGVDVPGLLGRLPGGLGEKLGGLFG